MAFAIVCIVEEETPPAVLEEPDVNLEPFNVEVLESVSAGSLFVMENETVRMVQMRNAQPHDVQPRLSVAIEVGCVFPRLDSVMEVKTVLMEKMRKDVTIEEVRKIVNLVEKK